MLEDESDKLGSEYGSSGTSSFCVFTFSAEESVYGVFASDIFATSLVDYISGVLRLEFLHQQESIYKSGRLL